MIRCRLGQRSAGSFSLSHAPFTAVKLICYAFCMVLHIIESYMASIHNRARCSLGSAINPNTKTPSIRTRIMRLRAHLHTNTRIPTPTILRFLHVLTLLTLNPLFPHLLTQNYTLPQRVPPPLNSTHSTHIAVVVVVVFVLHLMPGALHRQTTVPIRPEESLRCGAQRSRPHSVRGGRLSTARNVQMVIQQHRRNARHAAEWIREALAASVQTDLHPD